jgi:hypothetical protein
MDDRALALCELSNDLLFHKIPPGRIAYYTDGSLREGFAAAEGLEGADMMGLCRERGITVSKRPAGKAAFGVALRGTAVMGPKECSIEIYEDSVRAMAALCGLEYSLAEAVHLAHEFFHYLEHKSGAPVPDRLEKIVALRFLGLERKAGITRASEAAAHAFAKAVLGLPVLPNYYDYMYLIASGKMSQEFFDNKLKDMERMLSLSETAG